MLTPPVAPMLATATRVLPEPTALRGGCLYEPKFDGYRGLAFHHLPDTAPAAGPVSIQSRAGNFITHGFPDIAASITAQIPPGVVLDGELVVWDGTGINFTALAGRLGATRRAEHLATARPATFMVFDILAADGRDIRHLPLTERQQALAVVLADTGPPIQQVPFTRDLTTAHAWLADYTHTPNLGIEGLVIKGAGDRYASGKPGWLKYRVRHTHDVVVGAVLGHLEAPSRLVLGYHHAPHPTSSRRGEGAVLRVAGITIPLGSQQARAVGRLLTAHPAPDAAGAVHPWPEQMPAGWLGNWNNRRNEPTRVRLVHPNLVVEVSADTAFEHGRWRHQVRYVRVREDKDPAEVISPEEPRPD